MNAPSKRSNIPSYEAPPLDFRLERLIEEALRERIFSGVCLLAASPERIVIETARGRRRFGGGPIDFQTHFDLASLTKPLVTAALFMTAVSQGRIGLEDPLRSFFPRSVLPRDKEDITTADLLNHSSGLPPYHPFFLELIQVPPEDRKHRLLSSILRTPLLSSPREACRYSDLGFILLGFLLETIFDSPLDRLASQLIFDPIGAGELGFRPLVPSTDPADPPRILGGQDLRFAATEDCPWRKRLLQGEVHDENAYCLGGVAGHAGLFGTARGVFTLISFLWGVYRNASRNAAWSSDVLKDFWTRRSSGEGDTWALGFDTPSPAGSSAGNRFSPRSVGHLGFTGTSFWLDLEQEVLIILLTNRVHPTRANERMKGFRPLLHNTVMESIDDLSRN